MIDENIYYLPIIHEFAVIIIIFKKFLKHKKKNKLPK